MDDDRELSQILANAPGTKVPRVISTLHGTDVTLIGSDSSYSETAAFCIDQSDGVTAVSESLRDDTYREMPVRADIRVIPNFLDCSYHRRSEDPALRARFTRGDAATRLVIHVSNFRPVKRVSDVVRIFDRVQKKIPSKLLFVGEGPERLFVQQLVKELQLTEHVYFLGEQDYLESLLSCADLFVLPSEQESFGLVALEAMSCQVPVIGTSIGGLPEVVAQGETGFLFPVGEIQQMADAAIELLSDEQKLARFRRCARQWAVERFDSETIIPRYEQFYQKVLEPKASQRTLS